MLTNPEISGGLGFRRLNVMNKACILKLGRKLQIGSQDLVVRLCGVNTVEKHIKILLLLEVLIHISGRLL